MPTVTETRQRAAFHHLAGVMRELEADLRWGLRDSERIPRDWHRIAAEDQVPCKTKVTLRLDDDVLRFFRSMGRGHLTRINAVLRSFMLARLAGVVKGAAEVDYSHDLRAEYLREMDAYMRDKPVLDRRIAQGGPAADKAIDAAQARLDRIQALLLAMLDGVAEGIERAPGPQGQSAAGQAAAGQGGGDFTEWGR